MLLFFFDRVFLAVPFPRAAVVACAWPGALSPIAAPEPPAGRAPGGVFWSKPCWANAGAVRRAAAAARKASRFMITSSLGGAGQSVVAAGPRVSKRPDL